MQHGGSVLRASLKSLLLELFDEEHLPAAAAAVAARAAAWNVGTVTGAGGAPQLTVADEESAVTRTFNPATAADGAIAFDVDEMQLQMPPTLALGLMRAHAIHARKVLQAILREQARRAAMPAHAAAAVADDDEDEAGPLITFRADTVIVIGSALTNHVYLDIVRELEGEVVPVAGAELGNGAAGGGADNVPHYSIGNVLVPDGPSRSVTLGGVVLAAAYRTGTHIAPSAV